MEGGTIGWGFQVMLIPLIYLISGWRWALFTSDGETENGGREQWQWMKKSEYKETENEDEGVAGRWDG